MSLDRHRVEAFLYREARLMAISIPSAMSRSFTRIERDWKIVSGG